MNKTSAIICVGPKDIRFFFEYCIKSILKNVSFIDEIIIVTPDKLKIVALVKSIIEKKIKIKIFEDNCMLSPEEMELPGWSKQQIIKLRSYKLSRNKNILCIGSDVIIFKDLNKYDFFSDKIIINHRISAPDNKHLTYEKKRSANVYNILNSKKKTKYLLDYIFDIFPFDAVILKELEHFIQEKHGGYLSIFPQDELNDKICSSIGEWTLYSIFVIEIYKKKFKLIGRDNFIEQYHSFNDMDKIPRNIAAAHIVLKEFKKEFIEYIVKKHEKSTSNK